MSQLLIERHSANLGASGASHLLRIREAAQRTRAIIDDLLRLAHLGTSELRRQPVNASNHVRAIASELRALQPDRRVDVVVEDGVWVEADEALLHAALVNLVGNAWKFTGRTPEARIEFGCAT